MASVTLQVGPFTVQIEDEDETAKVLTKLAHKEIAALFETFEVPESQEAEDG